MNLLQNYLIFILALLKIKDFLDFSFMVYLYGKLILKFNDFQCFLVKIQ